MERQATTALHCTKCKSLRQLRRCRVFFSLADGKRPRPEIPSGIGWPSTVSTLFPKPQPTAAFCKPNDDCRLTTHATRSSTHRDPGWANRCPVRKCYPDGKRGSKYNQAFWLFEVMMVPREAKMVHSLTLRQHVLNHPLPQDSALQLSASLFLEDSYIVTKTFAPLTPANFYFFSQ
jgi:hypothetical protein